MKNVLFVALLLLVCAAYGSYACNLPNGGNPVACENTQSGANPEDWDIIDSSNHNQPDANLVGFATSTSVNQGSTISFKISTTASSYSIDIYRLGYYLSTTSSNGGARLVAGLGTFPGTNQNPCNEETTGTGATGLVDCGNWTVSPSWAVP